MRLSPTPSYSYVNFKDLPCYARLQEQAKGGVSCIVRFQCDEYYSDFMVTAQNHADAIEAAWNIAPDYWRGLDPKIRVDALDV